MLDDLRTYLQMASGITEATAARAKEVVTGLVASGFSLTARAKPATEMVGQVQELADDLVATSRSNRELLTGMIRSEVDKAVGRVGFVREDELAALRRHVQRLEASLHELQASVEACSQGACCQGACCEGACCEGACCEPKSEDVVPAAPAAKAEDVPAEKPKKKKVLVDPEAGA